MQYELFFIFTIILFFSWFILSRLCVPVGSYNSHFLAVSLFFLFNSLFPVPLCKILQDASGNTIDGRRFSYIVCA